MSIPDKHECFTLLTAGQIKPGDRLVCHYGVAPAFEFTVGEDGIRSDTGSATGVLVYADRWLDASYFSPAPAPELYLQANEVDLAHVRAFLATGKLVPPLKT